MTAKTQQSLTDWIYSTIIILAAATIVTVAGVKVSAAESAPISHAQVQLKQQGPGAGPGAGAPSGVKAAPKRARVLCEGKTTAQCCVGISFCSCLGNPMPKEGDKDKPLACESNPPPSKG